MPHRRALQDRTATSPEVSGRAVTFRLLAPQARRVEVALNYPYADVAPLSRSADGTWTVTLTELEPRWYTYFFYLDGVAIPDPANPRTGRRINQAYSLVNVPSDPPRLDEQRGAPRGVVHRHYYDSRVLGRERRLFVYTPAVHERALPVLYLRHGAEQVEDSWLAAGRADTIADNLIAEGRAQPMIIVMTNGYAVPQTGGQLRADRGAPRMITRLAEELRHDIVPFIDAAYRTRADAAHRAIAGLSMGAGQAFQIGLNHLDLFGSVGEFSSGVLSARAFDLARAVPALVTDPESVRAGLRSLWLGCGADDRRVAGHARLRSRLAEFGIEHGYHEVPGSHEWRTWRALLAAYLPTLFH